MDVTPAREDGKRRLEVAMWVVFVDLTQNGEIALQSAVSTDIKIQSPWGKCLIRMPSRG